MKLEKHPVRPARVSVIQEFVKRKQAVKELNRYKERLEEMVEERSVELSAVVERYRLFFRNSIDGMLILSSEGTILEANPEACRLFGLGEDEVCGVGWEDLVFGEDTCFS